MTQPDNTDRQPSDEDAATSPDTTPIPQPVWRGPIGGTGHGLGAGSFRPAPEDLGGASLGSLGGASLGSRSAAPERFIEHPGVLGGGGHFVRDASPPPTDPGAGGQFVHDDSAPPQLNAAFPAPKAALPSPRPPRPPEGEATPEAPKRRWWRRRTKG